MGKKIYTVNENFFSTRTTEAAYIAGFLMADGCICKRKNRKSYFLSIGLNSKDIEILHYIKNTIGYTGPIRVYETFEALAKLNPKNKSKRYKKASLQVYNQKICADLMNLWNIIPRKTGYEKLPELDDPCFYAFVRGLIDGDGSIYNGKGHSLVVRIFSLSRELLENIKNRLNMGSIYKGKTCYVWLASTEQSLKLRDLIYNDNGFALKRKKDRMFKINTVFGIFNQREDDIISEGLTREIPLQFKELGVLLGKNQESVAKRAEVLGLYSRKKLRRFTVDEIAYIKSQINPLNKSECIQRLADELNVGYKTMRWKVYSL